MAAEGSEFGSQATATVPPLKRRKIEPPRSFEKVATVRSRLVEWGVPAGTVEDGYKGRVCLGYRPQLSGGSGQFDDRQEEESLVHLRNRPSQVALDKDKVVAASNSSVSVTLPARVDMNKVREAKRFAVFQAQHDGCLGSYKSFDSLFGNYLVPVIPSDDFFEQIAKK